MTRSWELSLKEGPLRQAPHLLSNIRQVHKCSSVNHTNTKVANSNKNHTGHCYKNLLVILEQNLSLLLFSLAIEQPQYYFMLLDTCAVKPLISISQNRMNQNTLKKMKHKLN